MKKKRIKQKEDKKTDRKHGNRTRKAILGILSVLVLLCLNSCGRELEEREFPDTLVIRPSMGALASLPPNSFGAM